jgi:hypothetical protein
MSPVGNRQHQDRGRLRAYGSYASARLVATTGGSVRRAESGHLYAVVLLLSPSIISQHVLYAPVLTLDERMLPPSQHPSVPGVLGSTATWAHLQCVLVRDTLNL